MEQQGFKALSAREIAREIGYAPGTLYNLFRNLDEILLRVETRILDDLDDHIESRIEGLDGAAALTALARSYIEFAFTNPRLWELVQFHQPTIDKSAPDWYLDRLYAPMNRIEPLLSSICATEDAEEAARNARHLWSVVHALVNTALTPKLGVQTRAATTSMVESAVAELLAKNGKVRHRRKDEAVRGSNGTKRDDSRL